MRVFRSLHSRLAALAAAAALIAISGPADADERHFPFTYDWFQSARGEKEIALQTTSFGRDNFFKHELELEYGISQRFSIAPYFVFENGEGRSLHFDAFKVETRYQLGSFAQDRVLPGLYLEYEKATDEVGEFEGKLILSRYDRHGGDVSFNYIFEQSLATGAKMEHIYSLGYSRPLRGARGLRGGVELIHELSTGKMNVGPSAGFEPNRGTWILGGIYFPLNSRGGNGTEIRLRVQHHWF